MAAANPPGTDEERAEAALIAAAGNILRSENREVPEDFVAALFAYAVPEDLMRYAPRQLAELAANAWSLLAVRKPGVPKIRLEAFDPAGHERQHLDLAEDHLEKGQVDLEAVLGAVGVVVEHHLRA